MRPVLRGLSGKKYIPGFKSLSVKVLCVVSAVVSISACGGGSGGGGSSDSAVSLEYQPAEFRKVFNQAELEVLSDAELNELGKQLLDFNLFAGALAYEALEYYDRYDLISTDDWPVPYQEFECDSGTYAVYADYDENRLIVRYDSCEYDGALIDGDIVYTYQKASEFQNSIRMEYVDFGEGSTLFGIYATYNGYIDIVADYDTGLLADVSYKLEVDWPIYSRPFLIELSQFENEGNLFSGQHGQVSFESGYIDIEWSDEKQASTWVDGASSNGVFKTSDTEVQHSVSLADGRTAVAYLNEENKEKYDIFSVEGNDPEIMLQAADQLYSDEVKAGISLVDMIQDADFDLLSYDVLSVQTRGSSGLPVLFDQQGEGVSLSVKYGQNYLLTVAVDEFSGEPQDVALTLNISVDMDRDGTSDSNDNDIDGDGVVNDQDPDPYDASAVADFDDDGIPDSQDHDTNGNGIADVNEELDGLSSCSYLQTFDYALAYSSSCLLSEGNLVDFYDAYIYEDIVYLHVSSGVDLDIVERIHRWDLVSETWLTPLELDSGLDRIVSNIVISSSQKRLYVVYEDKVEYFNISGDSASAQSFINDSSSGLYFSSAGYGGLLVSGLDGSDYEGVWLLDESAQAEAWGEGAIYCSDPIVGLDSEQSGRYFCTWSSSLIRLDVAQDASWEQTYSPSQAFYKDDWSNGWLVFADSEILFADGKVYDDESLTQTSQLEGHISAALPWGDDQVLVARKLTTGSQLELLDDEGNRLFMQRVPGAVKALLNQDDTVVVVYQRGDIGVASFTFSDDMDGDGVANADDAFPYDPSASLDEDGDGYPTEYNQGYDDSLSSLVLDAFPMDSTCHMESQGADGECSELVRTPQVYPDSFLSDKDGVVYLYNKEKGVIYRWASQLQEYLSPLDVDVPFDQWLYHPGQHRIYAWSEGIEAFSFNLSELQPRMEHFVYLNEELKGIQVVGDWASFLVGDMLYPSTAWILDEDGKWHERYNLLMTGGAVGGGVDSSLYVQSFSNISRIDFDEETGAIKESVSLVDGNLGIGDLRSVSSSGDWMLMTDDSIVDLDSGERHELPSNGWTSSSDWEDIQWDATSDRLYAWDRSESAMEVVSYIWQGTEWVKELDLSYDGYGLGMVEATSGLSVIYWTAQGVVYELLPTP